jgi:hypothetical protein
MNMIYVAIFLAGALLCNAVPHLVAGLQGQSFPTPFVILRGGGSSPPVVNFLWGAVSLAAGIALLVRNRVTLGMNPRTLWLAAGIIVIGLVLAHFYGRIRGKAS